MASFNSVCCVLLLLMINSRSYVAAQLAPVSVISSDGVIPNGNFEEAPNPSNLKKITIVGKYSLPKWVKRGLVRYVSGGHKRVGFTFNVSRDVHAVSLGQDASILQYMRLKHWTYYSITFSATRTCPLDKFIRITYGGGSADFGFPSKTLYLSDKADTFAWGLRTATGTSYIHFSNPTGHPKYPACGPLIQAVAIKELPPPPIMTTGNNLIHNGNFEIGPYTLENFTTGVYIHPYTLNPISPLPGWIIESRYTIRYITSKDFFIPSGSSAVELLVGGKTNAIAQVIGTTPKMYYNLTFTIGDANNGCIGSMEVQASADKETIKVKYESQGKGGVTHASLRFQAVSLSFTTRISFWSVFYHNTIDDPNRFCGPVLDNVRVVLDQ
ncbi:protein DUF642 L-GALACTONO-1,4-LACTONE-RESPONSIVE GENE 2-like [Spinacia oleracea]|uniref:Protein DUF642 L-GALACTONO-1,4-LACTONE-RESPONSIVE GENE 2-like n=1 Tax=Spinacia oleracea TaxID=3562 RepID=A0A9R0JLY3_SPIOL|nr:protein DUF642 L-GALACTONO-1,4-LACTONE-RESPONSIVE GENE 2-like [Spinacia oleracea]